jgi:IS30 family transposase
MGAIRGKFMPEFSIEAAQREIDVKVKNPAHDLEHIHRSLNRRPQRTLGYMAPLEQLAEFVALTS